MRRNNRGADILREYLGDDSPTADERIRDAYNHQPSSGSPLLLSAASSARASASRSSRRDSTRRRLLDDEENYSYGSRSRSRSRDSSSTRMKSLDLDIDHSLDLDDEDELYTFEDIKASACGRPQLNSGLPTTTRTPPRSDHITKDQQSLRRKSDGKSRKTSGPLSPFSPLLNRKRRRKPGEPPSSPNSQRSTTIDWKDEAMEDLSLTNCRKVSVVVTVGESYIASEGDSEYQLEYYGRHTPRHCSESNQVCLFPVVEDSGSPQKSLKGSPSKSLRETSTKVFRGYPNKSSASVPAEIATAPLDSRGLIVVNPMAFGKYIPVSMTMDTARLVAQIANMPSEDWARTYKFHQVLWSNSNKTDSMHNISQAIVNDLLAPGSIAHRILVGTASGLAAIPQQTQQLFGVVGKQSVARVFAQNDVHMTITDIFERYGLVGLTVHGILDKMGDDNVCALSVLEISDEESLFDLLLNKPFEIKSGPSVKIRYGEAGAFVTGLSETDIDSLKHVGHLIRRAFTAALHKNRRSGRGHIVVTVSVFAKHDTSKRTSCQFIDLAAVERDDSPAYARRNAAIRKSLWALGGVLRGTLLKEAGNDTPISYRESLLTKVLQRPMMQTDSRTIVIGSVSPDTSQYEETMATLRYVNRLLYRPGQAVQSPFASSLDSMLSTPTSLKSLHTSDPSSRFSLDQFAGKESMWLQQVVSDPRQRVAKLLNPSKQMGVVAAPHVDIETYTPTEYSDPDGDRPSKESMRDQGSILSANSREEDRLIHIDESWSFSDSGLPTPLARNGWNQVKESLSLSEKNRTHLEDGEFVLETDNKVSAVHASMEQDVNEHPPLEISPVTAYNGRRTLYDFVDKSFENELNVSLTLDNMAAKIVENQDFHQSMGFAHIGRNDNDNRGTRSLSDASERQITEVQSYQNDSLLDIADQYSTNKKLAADKIMNDRVSKENLDQSSDVEDVVEPHRAYADDHTPSWDEEISHLSHPSKGFGSGDDQNRWDRPVDQPLDEDELERILREPSIFEEDDFTAPIFLEEPNHQIEDKSLESLLRESDSEPVVSQVQESLEILEQHPPNKLGYDEMLQNTLNKNHGHCRDPLKNGQLFTVEQSSKFEMTSGWGNGKCRDDSIVNASGMQPQTNELMGERESNKLTREQTSHDTKSKNDVRRPDSAGGGQLPTLERSTKSKTSRDVVHGSSLVESQTNGRDMQQPQKPISSEYRSRESRIPTPLKQPRLRLNEIGCVEGTMHILTLKNDALLTSQQRQRQDLVVASTDEVYNGSNGEDLFYAEPVVRQLSNGLLMNGGPRARDFESKSSDVMSQSDSESQTLIEDKNNSLRDRESDGEQPLTTYDLPPESPSANPLQRGSRQDTLDDQGTNLDSLRSRFLRASGVAHASEVDEATRRSNRVSSSINVLNHPTHISVSKNSIAGDSDASHHEPTSDTMLMSNLNPTLLEGDYTLQQRIWEGRGQRNVSQNAADLNVINEIDQLKAAVDKVKQTNISVWQASLASIDNLRYFQSSQQETLAKLLGERNEASKEIEQLESDLERQSESHRLTMIQLEDNVEVARAEIEKIKFDRGEVVKIAEEAIATQAELEQRVTDLEQELSSQIAGSVPRSHYDGLEQRNSLLRRELDEARSQVVQYKEEIGDRNITISELQFSLKLLEKERKQLGDELSTCKAEIESLNVAIASAHAAKSEANALRTEMARLTKEIQAIQSTNSDREAELLRELEVKHDDVQQWKREAESANMELAAVQDETHAEIATRQNDISRLREQIERLQDENFANMAKLRDNEQRFADLQVNRDDIVQEMEQARFALDSRVSDVQDLTSNLKNLLFEKEKHQAKMDRMERALAAFQDETRSRVEKVVRHRNEAASLLEKTVNENKLLVETNQQLQDTVEHLQLEQDDAQTRAREVSAETKNRLDVAMKENVALAEANQQLRVEIERLWSGRYSSGDRNRGSIENLFRLEHLFDARGGHSSKTLRSGLRSEFELEGAFDRPGALGSRGAPIDHSDLQRAEEVAACLAFAAKSAMETNSTETHLLKENLFALEDAKDEEINALKSRIKSLERRLGGTDRRRGNEW